MDQGRVRVLINGLKPLEMILDVNTPSGELKQVEREYENLQKYCFVCHSLSHEKEDCPSRHPALRDSNTSFGISQTRTRERLDADRRRQAERKQTRLVSDHQIVGNNPKPWPRGSDRVSTHETDWSQDKNFRFTYGARRDPHRQITPQESNPSQETRPPAKARLSFSRDSYATPRGASNS